MAYCQDSEPAASHQKNLPERPRGLHERALDPRNVTSDSLLQWQKCICTRAEALHRSIVGMCVRADHQGEYTYWHNYLNAFIHRREVHTFTFRARHRTHAMSVLFVRDGWGDVSRCDWSWVVMDRKFENAEFPWDDAMAFIGRWVGTRAKAPTGCWRKSTLKVKRIRERNEYVWPKKLRSDMCVRCSINVRRNWGSRIFQDKTMASVSEYVHRDKRMRHALHMSTSYWLCSSPETREVWTTFRSEELTTSELYTTNIDKCSSDCKMSVSPALCCGVTGTSWRFTLSYTLNDIRAVGGVTILEWKWKVSVTLTFPKRAWR